MREIRLYGSEGGGLEEMQGLLPLFNYCLYGFRITPFGPVSFQITLNH
jgi:hypothetical protein